MGVQDITNNDRRQGSKQDRNVIAYLNIYVEGGKTDGSDQQIAGSSIATGEVLASYFSKVVAKLVTLPEGEKITVKRDNLKLVFSRPEAKAPKIAPGVFEFDDVSEDELPF